MKKVPEEMESFSTLHTTFLKNEVDDIGLILEENEINYSIISGKSDLTDTIGVSTSQLYEIRVKSDLLTKAYDLISDFWEKHSSGVDLSQLSDAEINDIVLNPDGWHDSFVCEAKKITKQRNINIYQDIIDDSNNMFSDLKEFPKYEEYMEIMNDINKYIDSSAEVIYFSKWKQLSKLLIVFASIFGLYHVVISPGISPIILLLVILLAIIGLGYFLVDSIRKFKAISIPQIVLNDNGIACRGNGFVKWEWVTDWEIKQTNTGRDTSYDLYVYCVQVGKNKTPRVNINLDDLNITPKKLRNLIENKINQKK